MVKYFDICYNISSIVLYFLLDYFEVFEMIEITLFPRL